MILAAGLGTRLKPWTDHHPKALAIVNGKSLLQRNVEYLQSYGITNVVVNVHHFANQIMEAITQNKGWGSNIIISDETNEVLETGGGLLKAQNLLPKEGDFILMNCDILTNLNLQLLLEQHQMNKAIATLAVCKRETSRYLLINTKNELVGWCNEKTCETKLSIDTPDNEITKVAFSGIHIINASLFNVIHFTGKFSMIDVYLDVCKNYTIQTYDHSNDILLDVGKPESIAKAEQLFL